MIGYKCKVNNDGYIKIPSDVRKKLEVDKERFFKVTKKFDTLIFQLANENETLIGEELVKVGALGEIKLNDNFLNFAYLKVDVEKQTIVVSNNQYEKIIFEVKIDQLNRIVINNEIKDALCVHTSIYLSIPKVLEENIILKSDGEESDILLNLDDINRIQLPTNVAKIFRTNDVSTAVAYLQYDFKSNVCTLKKDFIF